MRHLVHVLLMRLGKNSAAAEQHNDGNHHWKMERAA